MGTTLMLGGRRGGGFLQRLLGSDLGEAMLGVATTLGRERGVGSHRS